MNKKAFKSRIQLTSEHDQYKCMCMGFLESAFQQPEGSDFIETLHEGINKMERAGQSMATENLDISLMMVTVSRFAYMGLLATMDGLATRMEESDQEQEGDI